MPLRINNNIASLLIQKQVGGSQDRLRSNFAKLASGLRISKAADDAAGLGISPDVYNTLVETLALSARTLNCLKRAGLNRVGEVISIPKAELLKIRNFGQKSLDELYDKLAERNMLPEDDASSAEDGDTEEVPAEGSEEKAIEA